MTMTTGIITMSTRPSPSAGWPQADQGGEGASQWQCAAGTLPTGRWAQPQGEGSRRRALLRLLTWLSPAFPTGGLRLFARARMGGRGRRHHATVTRCASGWATCWRMAPARNDAILLRHAHRAATIRALFDASRGTGCRHRAGRERQAETLAQGGAFVRAAAAVGLSGAARSPSPTPSPSARWPACTASTPTPLRWRICRLDRQPDLGRGAPGAAGPDRPAWQCWPRWSRSSCASPPKHAAPRWTISAAAAFRSDLAAMRHETQYTRLFRS